jgi:hypothetical protein
MVSSFQYQLLSRYTGQVAPFLRLILIQTTELSKIPTLHSFFFVILCVPLSTWWLRKHLVLTKNVILFSSRIRINSKASRIIYSLVMH